MAERISVCIPVFLSCQKSRIPLFLQPGKSPAKPKALLAFLSTTPAMNTCGNVHGAGFGAQFIPEENNAGFVR
ncbi:hypothetical protein [Collimonas fungivorans]|uniref:hypothetical protein n=1 Tax=Collimonas fungivorans TaxID=158899 RepID=UPI003FA37FC2